MSNTNHLDLLYKLKKEVEKSNHTSLVHIINQIIKKVYFDQYTVSFVGHFSAGKSTLINNLLQTDILPSSPVPTTGNTAIVTVSDTHKIIANIENQAYTELASYEEVKMLNRENVNVESVEIHFESDHFETGFTLQDTPGVDSNVQAHQASAEAYMYTSNMVVYTVDYNHVQSALNFEYMKRLNERGIPVVFLINQIDKHDENEIAFSTFKQRVEQSMTDWDIDVERIFYVSKYEGPNNEFEAFSEFIHACDHNREPIAQYLERTTNFIINYQLTYIKNEMQRILASLDIRDENDFDQTYLNFQQNQSVNEEVQLLSDADKLYQYLKDKRKTILDNAYIMTHPVRELVRDYLESLTKDFKVGNLFNHKKKTLEAQTSRLHTLVDALQTKVNEEVRQPMREDMSFLTRFINQNDVNARILNQDYIITTDLISQLYQPQVRISNQYVLTFSDLIIKAIQQFVIKQSEPMIKDAIKHVHTDIHGDVEEQRDDAIYQSFITLRQLRQSLETRNYQHYYIHIDQSLDKLIDRERITYTPTSDHTPAKQRSQRTSEAITEQNQLGRIKRALDVIEPLPMFEQPKKDMHETIERLEQQVTKIGVFGTFSAGKSSLINALLGDQYLVSSPNPTTAAMTEVYYGDAQHIILKSKQQLLDEVNDMFAYDNETFEDLPQFIKTMQTTDMETRLEKNQRAFAQAIVNQFEMYDKMVDTSLEHAIDKTAIQTWTAEDQYAAFVHKVRIGLPIDWLKDKIIVDSLGLYSNNQRHTNETEKVLTSSDLILYVSYFNHAFTDNDKAFISHMKDMNQLHTNQAFKMVINASDLAESDADLEAVRQYVSDALAQVNMESDIYSVSSRNMLLQQASPGELPELKSAIDTFTKVTSKAILEQQMLEQLRLIEQACDEMVESFKRNASEIATRNKRLETYQQNKCFTSHITQNVTHAVENEIASQMHHFVERMNLQLIDDVKAVFNAQMTDSKDFNAAKQHAIKQFLTRVHQKLFLEQNVITLRIQKYFETQLDEQLAPIITQLAQYHVFVRPHWPKHDIEITKLYLTLSSDELAQSLPKHFTKKHLLQPAKQREIQADIAQQLVAYLFEKSNRYADALNTMTTQLKEIGDQQLQQLEQETQQQIQNMLNLSLDASQMHILAQTAEAVRAILKEREEEE